MIIVIDKVDVILRCKHYSDVIKERFENNIKNIPVANIIIETSSPLGIATMHAFRKVQTEFFVTLDDDVIIPDNWFEQVSKYMDSSVAAVDGYLPVKGLGSVDDVINGRLSTVPRKLEHDERPFLGDTLYRKEVFIDWEPSSPALSAWEDYEIGMHALKKNFTWVTVPLNNGYHLWSWEKVVSNAKWSAKGYKLTHPKNSQQLSEIIKNLVWLARLYIKNDELKYYVRVQKVAYTKQLTRGLVGFD